MNEAQAEGLKVFRDLQNSLKEAQTAFTTLAFEQKSQCSTIVEAAETASRMAVEASEAFAVSKPRLMALTALCAFLLASGGWLGGYWLGRHDGWQAGHIRGVQESLAVNAAASWANTPSGKMARRLDEIGNLQPLASCNIPGFSIQKGEKDIRWCVTAGPDRQFHGWALP